MAAYNLILHIYNRLLKKKQLNYMKNNKIFNAFA